MSLFDGNGTMNGNSYGHEYPITYGYSGHSIHERQVITNTINRIRTEM